MRRGEIYRTRERVAERGDKPGFYVVVSRTFVAQNKDVSTVICAPVYGEVWGLTTEVVVGPEEGLPRTSAVRCDFLTLMFTAPAILLSLRDHSALAHATAGALDGRCLGVHVSERTIRTRKLLLSGAQTDCELFTFCRSRSPAGVCPSSSIPTNASSSSSGKTRFRPNGRRGSSG